ncbi:hypothetical protein FIU89_01325 [Roseovarius sp. THAF27]|uniref:hypothetical protein n=1 Tax=Roseovarius sp. THAF27 TaxID=2587850 RepID=UPI0012A7EDCE|nr:hypothetical protein [Roseovarius sp. THAF27]QFT79234.1 hypothetical protein FIU89_01325 [Roseovarius sp. THAF27]
MGLVTATRHAKKGASQRIVAALFAVVLMTGHAAAQEQVERSFAVALIRDIMTAVNHGNWTGNYTVLRDYAAPEFSAANDPTRLAGLFTPVREAGLDMLPVLVTEPEILQAKIAAGGQQMRLTGYFPTRPQHFSFDMVLVNEGRRWVLLDISVGAFDPISAPAPDPSAEAQTDPDPETEAE